MHFLLPSSPSHPCWPLPRFSGLSSPPGTWHALAPVCTALGYAMTACLAMFGIAQTVPLLRARFGAIERGFYLWPCR